MQSPQRYRYATFSVESGTLSDAEIMEICQLIEAFLHRLGIDEPFVNVSVGPEVVDAS